MTHYIYHDLDSGPLIAPLSLLADVPLISSPSDFLMHVCRGFTVAYSGSLRGLDFILSNPKIFDTLAKNPENIYDFRYRLDVLSDLVQELIA